MQKLEERKWTKKDGTVTKAWVFRYIDINGKETRKQFKYKPTTDECSKLLKTISNNPKFKEFTNDFIHRVRIINCKESTIETYDNYFRKNLCLLWNKKLKDIKDSDIRSLLLLLKENEISEKTRINILSFLKSVFKHAVTQGIILKNPAQEIHLGKTQRKIPKAFNNEEIKCFEEIIKDNYPHYVYVLLMVLLHTGCRISEGIALTWADIDFNKAKICFNKQFYRGRLTSIKNYEARTIRINTKLLNILQAYKEKTNGENLVFTLTQGKHINTNNIREHYFNKIMKELGAKMSKDFTEFTPHCLRHTHATYLLLKKVRPEAVAERLGHKDVTVTLRIYSHVLEADEKEIMTALENL